MAALRTLALAAGLAFVQGHWQCGNDHPVHRHDVGVTAFTVDQDYGDEHLARRLSGGQVYDDSGVFVPIAVADAANATAPLRITVLWDVVLNGDTKGPTDTNPLNLGYQCTAPGQQIQVRGASGSWEAWSGCEAKHIVTGLVGRDRFAAMQARTNAAVAFWQSAIRVKPVRDSITINSDVRTRFNLPATALNVSNSDLVLIMTARPSPFSPIAGFATCQQRDQRGRCTIGNFNWVPEVLNVGAAAASDDVVESELHTALHEIVHVLGGMAPGETPTTSSFISSTGTPLSSGVFKTELDPAYPGAGKYRTIITTPKVVAFTRQHYGCDAAEGFPLEDVPLGKGSHWEARVAGPELMSYGSGSGQVYISDLTMGYLEDTGHYVPDYSKAGPIITPRFDDFLTTGSATAVLEGATSSKYVPPPPPRPGTPRWGYKAGCSFLNGSPKAWPAAYTCSKNQDYTCTPDNRMSAVCVVRADWNAVPSKPTCGRYVQASSGSTGPQCELTNDAGTNLPTWAQFFATDADAAAAAGVVPTTGIRAAVGGYNDAMDYVPLRVGYWNCQFAKPSDNATGSYTTSGSLLSVASSFGSSTDMDNFGGQARCPNCRCLKSSLMELSRGSINPKFPAYGLCYRTNCARSDYLQVAIKGQLDGRAYWYKCPADGGKLYVPGFVGALTCPPATEFCALETITGVRYPEQDIVLEAIFWGVLVGGAVIAFFICSCPCLRDRVINCSKRCCGARAFEPPGGPEEGAEPPALPRCPSRTLLAVNSLTLLAGAAIIAVVAYVLGVSKLYGAGINVLGVGCLVFLLSITGLCAGRKRAQHGPSCWLLTFFFADLALLVLLLWSVCYNFAFQQYGTFVDKYYDSVSDAGFIPAGIVNMANATQADKVAAATAVVQRNVYPLIGMFAGILVVYAVSLFAAGRMLTARVLVSITITFVNNMLLALGTLFLVVGLYVLGIKGKSLGNVQEVIGYTIALGALFAVIGSLGHVGVAKKNNAVIATYLVLLVALAGVTAAGTWLCFDRQDTAAWWLSRQDDKAIGEVASALGMSVDVPTLVAQLKDNLRQLGLAFGCILILLVVAIACTAAFWWAVRVWRQENGLAVAGSKGLPVTGPLSTRPGPSAGPSNAGPKVGVPPQVLTQPNPHARVPGGIPGPWSRRR